MHVDCGTTKPDNNSAKLTPGPFPKREGEKSLPVSGRDLGRG